DDSFLSPLLASSPASSSFRVSLLANLAFGEFASERVRTEVGADLLGLMAEVLNHDASLAAPKRIVAIVDLFASVLFYLPYLVNSLSLAVVNQFVCRLCEALTTAGVLDSFGSLFPTCAGTMGGH